ncbi:hypothetical protein ACFVJ5_09410 [Nocardia sp. NPDC127606]|uniref:hypothetical protein n=1 Tax=Nocardia sp. NPDC127606 TaxID=3345406 RepID=UPI0036277BA8
MSSTESPSTADLDSGGRSMPAVNIAGHLRQLIRVLPFALVAAIIVGGAVWLVRDGSERTYQASITVQISQPSIGAVFNELTQPYIVMVSDTRVLSDVVKNGLAPSEADLRPRVSAMTGPAPSLLIITAEAGSPEQASKLVVAVEQSLDSVGSQMRTEAIARSAADLEAHRRAVEDTFSKRLSEDPLRPELSFDARDVARETEFRQVLGPARLTVLTAPSWELVAPHPVQEGLFAALATLIVVAEGLVLAGVARGRRRGGKKSAAATGVDTDKVPPTAETRAPAPAPASAPENRTPAAETRAPAADSRMRAAPTPPASFDTPPRRAAPVTPRSATISHDPETMALPRVGYTPSSPRATPTEPRDS